MKSEAKRNKEVNVNEKTRRLVVISMMSALIAIMSYTPLGMVPLPTASATTVHIPVIITAVLEGPVAGLCVGLVMGFVSMFRALTPSGPLDLLFLNPLVSVLPRALIPITAYFTYVLFYNVFSRMFKKGSLAAYFLAGAVGSITNTIGCLGMLYVIYAQQIVEKLTEANGGNIVQVEAVLLGIITTSGIAEMIVVAIAVTLVTPILKKIFYK